MPKKDQIRVMIVEDEPSFRELVQLVLSLDSQFEIVGTAGSGEEALDGLEEARPDLVLLDFRLPGIDGLETAKRMIEQRPGIKIAMVTAHSEEVLSRFAKDARIHELIPKASFSLERVRQLVETC
ncbi:MAG: response regulator transcription factor [Dehalococcoidia bacterium]